MSLLDAFANLNLEDDYTFEIEQEPRLDDIVPDLILTIMMFIRDRHDLLHFSMLNKYTYDVLASERRQSIDEVRISYLNNSNNRLHDSRIFNFFDGKHVTYNEGIHVLEQKRSFEYYFDQLTFMHDENYLGGHLIRRLFEFNKTHKQKFYVAGGSIFLALRGLEKREKYSRKSDIDIFMITNGEPLEDCDKLVRSALEEIDDIKDEEDEFFWQRNTGTVNLISTKYPKVQIIINTSPTIEHLLMFFDLDCARFAYDGDTVYTTREGYRSILYDTNMLSLRHRENSTFQYRVKKYLRRGVKTTVVDLHPLDHLFPVHWNGYNRFSKEYNRYAVSAEDYDLRKRVRHQNRLDNIFYGDQLWPLTYSAFFQLSIAKDLPFFRDDVHDNFLNLECMTLQCWNCEKYVQFYRRIVSSRFTTYTCSECRKIGNLMLDAVDKSSEYALAGTNVLITNANGATSVFLAQFLSEKDANVYIATKSYDRVWKKVNTIPQEKLHVYGVDFQDFASVEKLVALCKNVEMDIVINLGDDYRPRPGMIRELFYDRKKPLYDVFTNYCTVSQVDKDEITWYENTLSSLKCSFMNFTNAILETIEPNRREKETRHVRGKVRARPLTAVVVNAPLVIHSGSFQHFDLVAQEEDLLSLTKTFYEYYSNRGVCMCLTAPTPEIYKLKGAALRILFVLLDPTRKAGKIYKNFLNQDHRLFKFQRSRF